MLNATFSVIFKHRKLLLVVNGTTFVIEKSKLDTFTFVLKSTILSGFRQGDPFGGCEAALGSAVLDLSEETQTSTTTSTTTTTTTRRPTTRRTTSTTTRRTTATTRRTTTDRYYRVTQQVWNRLRNVCERSEHRLQKICISLQKIAFSAFFLNCKKW